MSCCGSQEGGNTLQQTQGPCRKRAAADAKLEGDEQIAAESKRLRQRCELFEQELQRLEKEKLEARDHADVLQHQLRWVPSS